MTKLLSGVSDIRKFTEQRQQMVQSQLMARGIEDKRVLSAMKSVPRHEFVPDSIREQAYQDCPLPIGSDQTISQPYIVALMTELLTLKGSERVLEIGTGSGYQTAVLAELVKEVISIERIPELHEQAGMQLAKYSNLVTLLANGADGCIDYAPYDAIIVTAAANEFSQTLFSQLKEGGIMVVPIGSYLQELCRITKENSNAVWETICMVRFVPLIDNGQR